MRLFGTIFFAAIIATMAIVEVTDADRVNRKLGLLQETLDQFVEPVFEEDPHPHHMDARNAQGDIVMGSASGAISGKGKKAPKTAHSSSI